MALASCKKEVPPRVLTAAEQQLVGTWRATKRVNVGSKVGIGLVKDSVLFTPTPPILSCRADGSYTNDAPSLFHPVSQGQFTYTKPIVILTDISPIGIRFTYTVSQLTSQGFVLTSLVNNDPNQYEAFTFVK